MLASGEDVNIMVFDTEVYSNTGDPGFYILAQAEGNDRIFDFAIYSADDYMKEN